MTNTVRSCISRSIPSSMSFPSGVHRAGGLIQHQHRGARKWRPGDVQQLALALAQVSSVRCQNGVIAVGEADEECLASLAASITSSMVASRRP